MEFALSQDQVMFQDSVRAFLESKSPLDSVRKSADGDAEVRQALNEGLTELGVTQMLVPEEFGGLGLDVLDAVLVQEMLGRHVAPADFVGGAAMAVTGIMSAGTEEQKSEWLPKIASGEVRFAIAAMEHIGAREGAGVTDNDGKLNGKSLFAMEVEGASHILVTDSNGSLHIVDAAAAGLSNNAMKTIDKTRGFTELTFDNVTASRLSGENDAGTAADAMIRVGRVLLAGDTLGAAQHMIEKAVTYAADRKQFGRNIATFQAVKHMCAEMAADLEPARSLVWHAAYTLDTDPEEAPLMACLAKSHLAEVGKEVARKSVEVHGGMGFTDLMGLHYWFKRIGTNRQLLGGPERLRDEAAKLQGWA